MDTLSLDLIRTDGGTQTRAALDQLKVNEYAERMAEGDIFPPIDVWFDGEFYWLSGGFHRLAARKQAQSASQDQDSAFGEIPATIHQGSLRDARLHGAGQNATHGLPRTNEEKRRVVMMLLEDPEWSTWGDNVIARYCHVSQPFVSKLRKSSTNNVISKRMYTRNGKVAEMNTSAIGANKAVSSSPSNSPDQIAYEWLKNYKDDKGRAWHDLTDNQTWHANSPCWQAFHKDHPTLSKGYLKNARRRLEAMRAAAACTPIWRLEKHIRDWLDNQAFPPDVIWRVTLPKLAELKKQSDYWESLTAVFPQPWRVNDVVQAINNVKYQLQQEHKTNPSAQADEQADVLVASADKPPHMAGNAVTIDNEECDKDEWYTPAWLIEMVREVLGKIGLDPASSHEAQTVVQAHHYWTKEQNALSLNWIVNINGPTWESSRVFLNPPYSHPLVEQFVDKLLQQLEKGFVSEAILLVNNNTETAWWHKAAAQATSVCFFRSRVFFWRPGQGEATSPRQGQNLFYFGPLVGNFADVFGPKGIIYRSNP